MWYSNYLFKSNDVSMDIEIITTTSKYRKYYGEEYLKVYQ